MQINKLQLLTSMKYCLPGVEKGNSLIEGADTFIFSSGVLHSYNDGISVSAPCEQINGLTGAVKSMEFFKLVNKLPGDIIEIETSETELLIKAGKVDAAVTMVNSKITQYIAQLNINELKWTTLPTNFFEALRLCKISANHSMQRGIYVNGADVVSTDTIRINYYMLDAPMGIFWLDDPAIIELVKIDNLIEFSISDAWVHFRNSAGVVFSCKRKADDSYPYTMLMKHVASHAVVDSDLVYKLPPTISEVVDRVSVLASTIRDYLVVKMTIDKNGITINSQRESGKIKENCSFDVPLEGIAEGQVVEMWVDPGFLIEASRKVIGFVVKSMTSGGTVTKNLVFFNDNYLQVAATFVGE